MSMKEKIHVIAQIHAKAGSEATIRALLQRLVGNSRIEAGCLHYELFEEKKTPGSFFTHEQWESEAALQAHMLAIEDTVAAAMPHFATPPDIRVLASVG